MRLFIQLSLPDAEPLPHRLPKHLMKEEKVAPVKVVGTWTPKERPELGTVEYTKGARGCALLHPGLHAAAPFGAPLVVLSPGRGAGP
ncbi:hypothetical protein VT84_24020 [Gemmata sp. SH-PL17]|uniref:hypothetical protein n=1 Tax=Gemmata sp. SH-PL17 TaxID=1630693 RepID=UPI0004B1B55C|nr:hypothetical protein [Gemmata sp. SH-PL17]AMV27489.1 hypothetical protein VT84_24020 [Gemmata sp. SH-PL17]